MEFVKNMFNCEPRMSSKIIKSNQLNGLITSSAQILKKNLIIVDKFRYVPSPHTDDVFQKAIYSIYTLQFHKYFQIDYQDEIKFWNANSKILISMDAPDILVSILNELFRDIFDEDYSIGLEPRLLTAASNMLNVLLFYSDISKEFAEEICKKEVGMLDLAYTVIDKLIEKLKILSKIHYDILKMTINILYNTSIHDSFANTSNLREKKFIGLIKPLLQCENKNIKIAVTLLIAYIADDEECLLFKSDHSVIKYLTDLLTESLNSTNRKIEGFTTKELAKGIERLSKNDSNKRLLFKLNILPVLEQLLAMESFECKKLSLYILWNLTFDKTNKDMIKTRFSKTFTEIRQSINVTTIEDVSDNICVVNSNEFARNYRFPNFSERFFNPQNNYEVEDELISKGGSCSIELVTTDENETIPLAETSRDCLDFINNGPIEIENRKSFDDRYEDSMQVLNAKRKCLKIIDGMRFTLEEPTNEIDEFGKNDKLSKRNNLGGQHVMISYSHSNKDIAMSIYEALSDKYDVWIDKHKMYTATNMMQSFAKAIHNSFAVIMCISQSYGKSNTCRNEAQFAMDQKKPLIPVIVEKNYGKDEWLGFYMTNLYYFDFTNKFPFETSIKELINKLEYLRSGKIKNNYREDFVDSTVTSTEMSAPSKNSNYKTWNHTEVSDWFDKIQVTDFRWNDHYTGLELEFLRSMSYSSVNAFYEICKTDLKISDLRNLRLLTENLKKL